MDINGWQSKHETTKQVLKIVASWWFKPLWKIWKSVGIIVPNMWKNKIHVPNHQPGGVNHSFSYTFYSHRIPNVIHQHVLFVQDPSTVQKKKTCPYVLHFFYIILGGFCQETASVSCLSCSAEQFQSPSNARCTLEPLHSARELLAPVEPQAILHARICLRMPPAK